MVKITVKERSARIVLSRMAGVGNVNYWRLIDRYGLATAAVEAARAKGAIEKDLSDWEANNLRFGVVPVVWGEPEYPPQLLTLSDRPPIIYCRGNMGLLSDPAVAVVGSRKPTGYGQQVTTQLVRTWASWGVVIVSGLARGIDTAAHNAALAVGGKTIAVLAGGLDWIYPSQNQPLASQIVKSGGLLISEQEVGIRAVRGLFPYRNRLIAALGRAVAVTEMTEASGTMTTVQHAASQGKTVLAVPGSINNPLSRGTNKLIKDGAVPLTEAGELLEYLPEINDRTGWGREAVQEMDRDEGDQLLSHLIEPVTVDKLGQLSGWPVDQISARLLELEIRGVIANLGGGYYAKVSK